MGLCFPPMEQLPKLPESLQPVAEVIGRDAALSLVEKWPRHRSGRLSIYIPQRVSRAGKLVEILGDEKAAAMCAHFGLETVRLAGGALYSQRERRAAIAEAVAAGETHEEVAERYGVTVRTVFRALACHRCAGNQVN